MFCICKSVWQFKGFESNENRYTEKRIRGSSYHRIMGNTTYKQEKTEKVGLVMKRASSLRETEDGHLSTNMLEENETTATHGNKSIKEVASSRCRITKHSFHRKKTSLVKGNQHNGGYQRKDYTISTKIANIRRKEDKAKNMLISIKVGNSSGIVSSVGRKTSHNSTDRRIREEYNEINSTNICSFAFDSYSLVKAKMKLHAGKQNKAAILFFIHLIMDTSFQQANKNENDDLFHWQYVVKKEKFLIQLPIDFDLVTFNLLEFDMEEMHIDLKTHYNNTNCTELGFNEKVNTVRFMLWNELLLNSTDYYLCNRYFHFDPIREMLYYITTIWIGFDLNCSEIDSTGNGEMQLDIAIEKDQLPLVTPFFCYFLSLQFVWIFAVLDVGLNRFSTGNKYDHSENDFQNLDFSYRKDDRPLGTKRVLLKMFFSNWSTASLLCCDNYKTSCKHWPPSRKLMLFMWIFILLPFGVYRTAGRYTLGTNTYKDYSNVVRTSEPLFSLLKSETWSLVLDIVYGGFFPITGFIYVGSIFYQAYIKGNFYQFSFLRWGKKSERLSNKFTDLSDRYVSRIDLIRNICKDCCNPNRKSHHDDNLCLRFVMVFVNLVDFIFQLVLSLFPFFSFSAHAIVHHFDDCFKVQRFELPFSRYSRKFCAILGCIIYYLLSYICFFRPMISTYTFILRSITYILFVAFPIRLHIFRYGIMLFTFITYVIKYFTEIVNMNSEILGFIFEIKCRNKTLKCSTTATTQTKYDICTIEGNEDIVANDDTIGNEDTVSEDMFNYIFEQLRFVKKRFYFFIFKTLIVFMYLFITIETFLQSENSLSSASFKDVVELLLVLIGPYFISLFVKAGANDFLTHADKEDIENACHEYLRNINSAKEMCSISFTSGLSDCNSGRNEQYKFEQGSSELKCCLGCCKLYTSFRNFRSRDQSPVVINPDETTPLLANRRIEDIYPL